MRIFTETLMMSIQGLGFLSAFCLYYMVFYAVGEALDSFLLGNVLYILTTLVLMSYMAAREKIAAEDKMTEIDEKMKKVS